MSKDRFDALSLAIRYARDYFELNKDELLDLVYPELLEELKNYDPMKNKKEIKKALYREKPMAKLQTLMTDELRDYVQYITTLTDGTYVVFQVPLNEYSDTFTNPMEAHLLIRWIVD